MPRVSTRKKRLLEISELLEDYSLLAIFDILTGIESPALQVVLMLEDLKMTVEQHP